MAFAALNPVALRRSAMTATSCKLELGLCVAIFACFEHLALVTAPKENVWLALVSTNDFKFFDRSDALRGTLRLR